MFDDLEAAAKPLPRRPGEDATGIALRMMAEARVLPREFESKKAPKAQPAVVAGLTEPEARKAAMKTLADPQLRHDIEREARRRFHG